MTPSFVGYLLDRISLPLSFCSIMDEKWSLMASSAGRVMEKQQQMAAELSLNCPRCNSTNTKFCYFNNYSLSQPRHFCKACKRYWTRGGTIRNVPVGGGCRKNKRKRPQITTMSTHQNPRIVNPQMNTIPTNNYLGFSSGQLLHGMVSAGEVYSSDWISCSGMIQHQKISSSSGDLDLQLKDHSSKPLMEAFSPLQHTGNESGLVATKGHNYMSINGGGGWNYGYQNHHYPSEQVGLSSSDLPTDYYWNMSNVTATTAGNSWNDPDNIDSYVPSLI